MGDIPYTQRHQDFPPIKYCKPNSRFLPVLKERVNAYFSERGISPYANSKMVGKTFFLLTIWTVCLCLIYSNRLSGVPLITVQVLWHLTMFLMTVGIAHDASHSAYSARSWINRELNKVFDYVGINTYMWEFNHVKSHHRSPNIPHYDSAIDAFHFFRFHPQSDWRSFHKYQSRYIFIIYSLATLFKLFFLDFFSFRRDRIGFVRIIKHPTKELLYFVVTRVFVILYSLVLPLYLLSAPDWQIWTGFLIGHFLSGILLGVIFQVTHLSEFTEWPEPDEHGNLPYAYDRHILLTTVDFCPESRVVTWISGGLNLHVIHHLFPGINHCHFIPLTKILRATAAEFGMPYRSIASVGEAVGSHLRCLRQLGERADPLKGMI